MATISLGSNDYDSYATVEDAAAYLAADVVLAPVWVAASADTQKQALITATRLLQRMTWAAGSSPDLTTTPSEVVEATILLAAAILQDPALSTTGGSPASSVKRVKAGTAEVEFFSSRAATRLPPNVLTLLRPLLGSASVGGVVGPGGEAFGTCFPSRFDETGYRVPEEFR